MADRQGGLFLEIVQRLPTAVRVVIRCTYQRDVSNRDVSHYIKDFLVLQHSCPLKNVSSEVLVHDTESPIFVHRGLSSIATPVQGGSLVSQIILHSLTGQHFQKCPIVI